MTTATVAPPRDTGLRRALALSSSGAAGARLMGAVGGVLAARLLGPSGRGQLAVLMFLAIAGAMTVSAGVQFWVVREVARRQGVRSVGRVLRVHVLVMAGTVTALGLLMLPVIEGLAHTGALPALAAVGCAMTAATSLLFLALPNGARAMGVVAGGTMAAGAAYVLGGAVGLSLDGLSDPAALVLVLAATAIGNVVACGIAAAWARRAPAGATPRVGIWHDYRSAMRFGLPGGMGELVLIAMLRADVLLVAAFLPLRQVGLYAVATALAEVLWIVPDGVAQVVLPTSSKQPDAALTRRLLKAALAITAAGGVLLVLLAAPLIDLVFGPAFADASHAVPLLVVASLGAAVWKIVGAEVVARGTTSPRLWSACAGLAAMVVVDLVAIPRFGISGAALGSACGYALAAALVTTALRRQQRAHISIAMAER
jgi:O-antigen/teichoic acid export membrane protein